MVERRFSLTKEIVSRAETSKVFIQSGTATLSLPFAATGVETVTATVTFPTAFPDGVIPHVFFTWGSIGLAITTAVTAVSNTSFEISARDNVGTDYTTSQSLTITWYAIAP